MDAVLSFYALEHVADLHEAISNIKKLLKPGGVFYFLVPNVYENTADFIVADHVNHFSHSSLSALLLQNRFTDIDIDSASHHAAFVVSARLGQESSQVKGELPEFKDVEIQKSKAPVLQMAAYWSDVVKNTNL